LAKILIIDDDMITGMVLQEFLKEDGHEVLSIGDEDSDIESGSTFRPDLLITDFYLSEGRSGVEIARELRLTNDLLKVIVISGLPADAIDSELNGLPVSAILEKPVVADNVRALIRQLT
jgi:DNA-binding response OmpR family regulator